MLPHSLPGEQIMSKIDIAYLALVLIAFVGFAGVLAYYNHTCAEPHRK
jgi:hypothetical protein